MVHVGKRNVHGCYGQNMSSFNAPTQSRYSCHPPDCFYQPLCLKSKVKVSDRIWKNDEQRASQNLIIYIHFPMFLLGEKMKI